MSNKVVGVAADYCLLIECHDRDDFILPAVNVFLSPAGCLQSRVVVLS